ncbi:NADH-quinone oxidoreductase subunit NuoE family protein [Actinophytocola algeriensis]|jgi:NADH-quinone oxidoreductase subunit E|uniref:NADH-quinone oxidoreductase subunit E n=1 Tax=Actinophytocola algeriensis TaxID=1768010 RepID=A0A7W7QCS8_9PSEU|nr:NAD(P)H-dependent oxidoreductase subunit E [Actinophytocola algeriensis]MBB4911267.1 NADH-quinone oxidoreductase subunit E [Actinophytocola algeriensis]MBE1479206.1 NADH-quinone oxidoreductase subunit E [Actinophytocola algeriensis]
MPEPLSTGSTYGGSSVGAGETHAAAGPDVDVNAASPLSRAENEALTVESTPDLSVFGPDIVAKAQVQKATYPETRSALLPMLHLVQSVEGYVSQAGIEFCARQLNLSNAEVSAVATFYTMYKRKPCGEHLVSVCTNTLCAVLGGDAIYKKLTEHLSEDGTPLKHEDTAGEPGTPGSITIEHAECLAACDLGPVLQVNYEFYDNQTVDSAVELVDALRRGEKPAPTRGAPLSDLRTVELELAGFYPEDEAEFRARIDGPSAAVETLRGAQLAADSGWTAPAMPEKAPALPEVEKK